MKFTSCDKSNKENSRTANARFCEQYSFLESLFEQWNSCERTVVLCALLKRMSFSNLKFLQLAIQQNIIQNYGLQTKYQEEERDSNDVAFLNQLANKYKKFGKDSSNNCLSKDSLLHNSISFANSTENLDHYQKKQDILTDLLTYLPLLRPQNDEAKSVYMNLIPFFVEDSIQHIVPTDLVQQFFSYLLIHPAITSEDRRSLSHWLKHLQDHISSSLTTKQLPLDNNFKFSDLQSPYLTSSTSSLSSASWKTTLGNLQTGSMVYTPSHHDVSDWDLTNIQMTQDFCDDLKQISSSSTKISKASSIVVGNNSQLNQNNQKNASTSHLGKEKGGMDDLHVSFSKNGTEIFDFEYDDYKSNTHVGFETITGTDYLTVPESSGGSWNTNGTVKTRRSNSLTTATSCHSNPCSSVENLAITQKPRSFSLSGDSLRTNLTSHSSETRLDDIIKPNHVRYSHKVGMSGIGQWLKTLRLHKYVWLFTNLTYEQMLDITEDYLENLGVTKGARHKLVLCIQKLKDRSSLLYQIENDLMTGVKQPHQVLEDMTTIVTTPMKPVDVYNKDDVATLFYKVVDAIVSMVASKPIYNQQDEDTINVVLWLLERSLHNEAFMAQTNQLKEHKFKLSKIKNQYFSSKGHYNKNSVNNNGLNKLRWNNNQKHKSGSSEGLKMHRKNSNNMQNFPNFSAKHNNYLSNNQNALHQNSSHVNNNNNYYKSSSYPNFTSSNTRVLTSNVLNSVVTYNEKDVYPLRPSSGSQEVQNRDIQNVVHEFNESYRHSISNLISMQPLIMQQPIQIVSEAKPKKVDKTVLVKCGSKSETTNEANQKNKVSSIGDINSRLEFLCLQMTEQAIN
ncbi:protein Smaug [Culicoides brevitarsis]|uniref:protein Smaug n=1 Tax=Culicoides brevitarsis TaxID=469753 RepID=UPI00307B5D8A